MDKHTPGPWEAVPSPKFEGEFQIWDKPGNRKWATWIANVTTRTAPVECEANARLIAAAPDLLEAAEALRDNIDELNATYGMPDRLCWVCFAEKYDSKQDIAHNEGCELVKVRAAIQKARQQ